jgi:hypothetical protein
MGMLLEPPLREPAREMRLAGSRWAVDRQRFEAAVGDRQQWLKGRTKKAILRPGDELILAIGSSVRARIASVRAGRFAGERDREDSVYHDHLGREKGGAGQPEL